MKLWTLQNNGCLLALSQGDCFSWLGAESCCTGVFPYTLQFITFPQYIWILFSSWSYKETFLLPVAYSSSIISIALPYTYRKFFTYKSHLRGFEGRHIYRCLHCLQVSNEGDIPEDVGLKEDVLVTPYSSSESSSSVSLPRINCDDRMETLWLRVAHGGSAGSNQLGLRVKRSRRQNLSGLRVRSVIAGGLADKVYTPADWFDLCIDWVIDWVTV